LRRKHIIPQTFKGRVLSVPDAGFTPRIWPLQQVIQPSQIIEIFFLIIKMRENVNIRMYSYFRSHIEYTRPDLGLNIYREALARFKEFFNLSLCVYTQYVHEYRNTSLIELHFTKI